MDIEGERNSRLPDFDVPRTDWAELGIDQDENVVADFKLFSGIGVERNSKEQVIRETTFINGIVDGVVREWYLERSLHSEGQFYYERLHGEYREWDETGRLRYWRRAEMEITLESIEWDEKGIVIEHYRIPESGMWPDILAQLRAIDEYRSVPGELKDHGHWPNSQRFQT